MVELSVVDSLTNAYAGCDVDTDNHEKYYGNEFATLRIIVFLLFEHRIPSLFSLII